VPGATGTKSVDVAMAPVVRTLVDENASLVHAASLNRRNVALPVGTKPPTTLTVFRTGVPTGPPGEGSARRLGVRRWMVMLNVWHAPLLAQTVIGPYDPAALGVPVRKPSGLIERPGGSVPLVTEKVGAGVCGLDVNWWR
jgi:hypothetical protein